MKHALRPQPDRRPEASSSGSPEPTWVERWVLPYPSAWIVGLGLLVYARTLWFGFNFLDDNALVLDRQHLLRDPAYLLQAFREDAFRSASGRFYYRPLLTWSFMWDAFWGGPSPFAYRFTNLALHLAASCLAYRVLFRLRLSAGWSLFLALAVVLHPALAAMPAFISARNDSLLALSALPAFLAYLRVCDGGGGRWVVAHLALWTVGLLTKETAAVLPAVCLCHHWLWGRGRPLPNRAGLAAGWILAGLAWFALRSSMLDSGGQFAQSAGSFLPNAPAALALFGRAFLPVGLSVYPILDDVKLWCGGACLAAVVSLLATGRRVNWRLAAFGALWFVLWLLPALAKPRDILVRHDIIESRLYLPILGAAMMAAALGLEERWSSSSEARAGTGFAILSLWAMLAFGHSANYRDRVGFWENAVSTSARSAFARNNLGAMYFLDNRLGEAEAQWRKAVALHPMERLVHGNLGLVLMRRGAMEEAEREYKAEIAINPLYDHAHFNLGLLCNHQKRFAEAVRLWERTLEINPDYRDVYVHLIVYYLNARDAEKVKHYAAEAERRGLALPEELRAALKRAGM